MTVDTTSELSVEERLAAIEMRLEAIAEQNAEILDTIARAGAALSQAQAYLPMLGSMMGNGR